MDVLRLNIAHGNDILALSDNGVSGGGHDNVEVAHGALVPAVAVLVALIGAQQGEVGVDGLHQQIILAVHSVATQAEGGLLHQRINAHGSQHAAQTGAAGADALSQSALRQQVDLQRALGVLLADLGGHAHVGGDHALDLMVVDQLGDAEELLTHGAGRTTHIVGDQGQILGAPCHQLLNNSTRLAASQEAAAHNGSAVGDHGCRFLGSQYRFLCHFCSSYLFRCIDHRASRHLRPTRWSLLHFTSCRA